MHLWHELSVGEKAPEQVNVVIEIPKGSQNKYEIEKESGLIFLDRVLYGANFYPLDYGFIPQTYWEDGDALDAFVMTSHGLFPGCVVPARPVGILHMVDGGEGDDKLVCVPVDDPRFAHINDIKDLPPHLLKEMQHFLETYKMLQNKEVKISGHGGADKALEAVKKGMEMYKEKFAQS